MLNTYLFQALWESFGCISLTFRYLQSSRGGRPILEQLQHNLIKALVVEADSESTEEGPRLVWEGLKKGFMEGK